jgi:uncharacterized membrane protein YbhN (UPF0104 family)
MTVGQHDLEKTSIDGGPPALDPTAEILLAADTARGRRMGRRIRCAMSLATVAAVVLLVISRRGPLARSFGRLHHPHVVWVLIAVGLEFASMATFALMQRQLIRAGGRRIGSRPMMATIFAANALSVSVPVAGPELGAAYIYRRLKGHGADPSLASWCLFFGGLVSWIGGILVIVAGGSLSGNPFVAGVALLAGLLAVAVGVAIRGVFRRPQLPPRLERSASWLVARTSRLLLRPVDNPTEAVRGWFDGLHSLRLPSMEWSKVGALGLANWLADAGVLAVSILAVGAAVPWRTLLLVYGLATVVGSLGITPGGIGLVEGTLCLGLVSSGLPAALALTAVLLYRLVSFWLVSAAGWLVLLYQRLEKRARPVSIEGRGAL